MIIRRVRPGDAARLRDIRLRALQSDPAAFASSYEDEALRPDEWWDTWAALSSAGPDQATFVADEDDDLVGMAGAYRTDRNPRGMHLVAMWVDPEHRRRGTGRALTEAVVQWARRSDADEVTLWVAEGNDAASALYEAHGFEATGETQSLPSNPELIEHRMALSLGTRLRLPHGYVDLDPMTAADTRAFVEWVIAERTARLMDDASLSRADATNIVRARVVELLDAPPGTSHHFFTLKAGIDRDPRGWLWLSDRRRHGDRYFVIEELVVFEEFRGRGLAASAVESAIDHARSVGIVTIEAAVPVDNRAALRIAGACGFVEIARSASEVTVRLDIDPSRG